MATLSANWHVSAAALEEARRVRALVMGIHSMTRDSNLARQISGPIEDIHRSLDRLEDDLEPAEARRAR